MGDLYYFPELSSDVKKKTGGHPSSRKQMDYKIASTLEAGASFAKALVEVGNQGGVVCAIGLCDEKGELKFDKALKFLVVSSVFFLGLLAVRKVW